MWQRAGIVSAWLCVCGLATAMAGEGDVPTAVAKVGESPETQGVEFFERRVRPLLIGRCYKCHSAEASPLRGGLLLDSRPGWQQGGDSGPALVPGDPDASLIVKAVRYDNDEVQMPPEGKLPEREIAALVEWVRLGRPTAQRRREIGGSQNRER